MDSQNDTQTTKDAKKGEGGMSVCNDCERGRQDVEHVKVSTLASSLPRLVSIAFPSPTRRLVRESNFTDTQTTEEMCDLRIRSAERYNSLHLLWPIN